MNSLVRDTRMCPFLWDNEHLLFLTLTQGHLIDLVKCLKNWTSGWDSSYQLYLFVLSSRSQTFITAWYLSSFPFSFSTILLNNLLCGKSLCLLLRLSIFILLWFFIYVTSCLYIWTCFLICKMDLTSIQMALRVREREHLPQCFKMFAIANSFPFLMMSLSGYGAIVIWLQVTNIFSCIVSTIFFVVQQHLLYKKTHFFCCCFSFMFTLMWAVP